MATKCLITWLCQKKEGAKGISCGMSISNSVLDFLKLISDFHHDEYAILNVTYLNEEEAAEITAKGLNLMEIK